jgi:glycosyltransferase involved in cell wall biosynthesis
MMARMSEFAPRYVWPAKTFPFRLYFQSEQCRIFVLENLQHNFTWLSAYAKKVRPTDRFFVIVGCHYHPWLVEEAGRMFDALQLDRQQFAILFNDEREQRIFAEQGFSGAVVNQNAFLDQTKIMRDLPGTRKQFDAIYVARPIALKRHHLAAQVPNLALVAGNLHGANTAVQVPPHVWANDKPLTPDQVCQKINEARCGLILSEKEGASFVSSEYLLCGVPVVSTKSEGGRDVWYDDYNSRVVDAEPAKVREAVEFFAANPRDPQRIRQAHIELAQQYRARFVQLLDKTLRSCGVDYIDAERYFSAHYFHKMRKSIQPDFGQIFA